MSKKSLSGRTTLVVTALVVSGLSPAAASAAPANHRPPSTFTLSVHEGKSTRSMELRCNPAGGKHPHAAKACGDLAAVNGEFQNLGRTNQSRPATGCAAERKPVTVTAEGRWERRQISYQGKFTNPCVLATRTGAVFQF